MHQVAPIALCAPGRRKFNGIASVVFLVGTSAICLITIDTSQSNLRDLERPGTERYCAALNLPCFFATEARKELCLGFASAYCGTAVVPVQMMQGYSEYDSHLDVTVR